MRVDVSVELDSSILHYDFAVSYLVPKVCLFEMDQHEVPDYTLLCPSVLVALLANAVWLSR